MKPLAILAAVLAGLMAVMPGGVSAQAPYRLTVGAFAAPGSPWDQQWQAFKAKAEEQSAGAIRVKLLTRGEAGAESATMTYVRRNRLQFGGFTLAGTASVVPELDMLLTPFFYDNREQVDFIMDAYLLDTFQALFAEKGLRLIQWVEVGWLNTFSKEPLITPEDWRGKRMRVQASYAAQVMADSLDAERLQMPFPDVIPSLQTGLIDGGSTNMVIYGVTGLAGEAPHMTRTQHAYDTGVIVANLQWLQSLPEDIRRIAEGAFVPSPQARAMVRGMAQALGGKVLGEGATLHELSEEQRAAWRAATRDNHRQLIEKIGGRAQHVYDRMLEGRAEWRRLHGSEAG